MSSLVATLAGPVIMCTAFVNGIAATKVRAAMPCTHQVRKCASAAVCPSTPIALQPLAGEPADRRPLLERRIGLGDPQRLEQKAGHPEEQERADERPVSHLVAPARVAARDTVHAAVVEPCRSAAAL